MKFLIDENLSPDLAFRAIESGYPESAHVNWRGLASSSDAKIMEAVIADDWTLVTNNADDFRPRQGNFSNAPCYVGHELHAGLVCLNLPPVHNRADQLAFFKRRWTNSRTGKAS